MAHIHLPLPRSPCPSALPVPHMQVGGMSALAAGLQGGRLLALGSPQHARPLSRWVRAGCHTWAAGEGRRWSRCKTGGGGATRDWGCAGVRGGPHTTILGVETMRKWRACRGGGAGGRWGACMCRQQLWCVALYCTVSHCIALYCTVSHFIALYCTLLHCIPPVLREANRNSDHSPPGVSALYVSFHCVLLRRAHHWPARCSRQWCQPGRVPASALWQLARRQQVNMWGYASIRVWTVYRLCQVWQDRCVGRCVKAL